VCRSAQHAGACRERHDLGGVTERTRR
jgi:hypothetical protein